VDAEKAARLQCWDCNIPKLADLRSDIQLLNENRVGPHSFGAHMLCQLSRRM
jgi:hypothetical protein